MARRIVFTMARQIDGKNCMALRQSFHIPAPTERSAQQSMQQKKRRPRSGAKVMDVFPVNLCRESVNLHGPVRTTAFLFRALK